MQKHLNEFEFNKHVIVGTSVWPKGANVCSLSDTN